MLDSLEELDGLAGARGRHLIASGGHLDHCDFRWLARIGDEPERPGKPFTSDQLRLYEAEVKPILTKHCLKCHGEGPKIRGGFRLDSREASCAGATSGRPPMPGDPAQSLLVKAINYDELEMPPAGKLPAREIEVLTRWVKEGLPWTPDSLTPAASTC